MNYMGYQLLSNLSEPLRQRAEMGFDWLSRWPGAKDSPTHRQWRAWLEQTALSGFTNKRPPFQIQPFLDASGRSWPIEERRVTGTPFCDLVRFKKRTVENLPKVLLVAPMSGHFATLLRGTVQTLVRDHEVYLTDWLNVRDIPISQGVFDLESYIGHVVEFMQFLGPQSHLIGVCQPTVACLVATSVLSEQNDPATPASLTLMAGPIDTRINPTKVNQLAKEKPIEWFKQNLISTVPWQFPGGGRRVYPGFVQLSAFMSMNPDRHQQSFKDMHDLRVAGDDQKADAIADFYREYFAIMDLAEDYYLETVEKVFQSHELPLGVLKYQGKTVDLGAIRRTFLLTVEGERDDICGIGQTLAAQDLCNKLPAYRKTHHLQAGVGHYGVFSGKRWTQQIYPVVRSMIRGSV